MNTVLQRFIKKVKINNTTGCWEWQASRNNCGYGIFWDNKIHLAHRWIFQYIQKNLQTNDIICHNCDNPKCVNPKHLWQGNHSSNAIDSVVKKRHRTVKLNKKQILDIRASNQSGKKLAKLYAVTQSTICDIRKRRSWRHV